MRQQDRSKRAPLVESANDYIPMLTRSVITNSIKTKGRSMIECPLRKTFGMEDSNTCLLVPAFDAQSTLPMNGLSRSSRS